ncbi:MAG: autotransporter outer membrane beta-barrel domain-containing protein [Alphaproteobacteria bacterium]
MRSLKAQLAVSTAMASVVLLGYGGRNAFADCAGGGGTYLCSAYTNTTQTLTGAPLTVTTASDFEIITATGDALNLTGTGGLSFTDSNASTITGYDSGIRSANLASGALSITTTGVVTGQNNDGIFARNSGTDLTIEATEVDGNRHGILARNNGSGALSITATGLVTGLTEYGIYAQNYGTDLTIKAAEVDGNRYGILARNNGSGALSITATGPVTGQIYSGIYARNSNLGTDLTFEAASVEGQLNGIAARNFGSGALSITATGSVIGRDRDGINTRNYGTDLIVEVASVEGEYRGIYARNGGSGALSITATGTVTSQDKSGILADNLSTGTDLTIETAAVDGNSLGILAQNNGSGALSITSTGHVIGREQDGINAFNYYGSTDLTIVAVSAEGFDVGIRASNNGSGALSITATGTVAGNNWGIIGSNFVNGTDLTINVNSVSGGVAGGIIARNHGSGLTSITTNGTVTGGGTYAAIVTETDLGMLTNITLNSGAAVSATSGVAITNDNGDSNTIVRLGASVAGDVTLGNGSDDLTFDGGDFSAVTLFDGGDDGSSADGFVDRLTFANSGAYGPVDTSAMTNWEEIFLSNSVLEFTGDFTAPEILSLTDGSDLTITGNFTGTDGQLQMDVDLETDAASTLTITGTSTGTTTISVNAGKSGPATGNDITLVTVQGGGGASDFMLDGNPIGAYLFDLGTNGNEFFLTNASLSPETAVFESYLQILTGLNSLPDFNARFGGQGAGVTGGAPLGYAPLAYTPQSVALETQSVSRHNAIWARIEGTHSHLDPAQSTTGADYDVNQGKMRIGMDGQIAEADSGLLIAGVNASYGQAHADIGAASDNGTIEATGTSIGVSLTWLGSTGFYADAQAQYSWFSSNLDSDILGALESGNDGTGHALSLELGQRFENSHGFAITPQAQLTYAQVDFESFTSAFGTAVTAEEADSLKLRTGVAFEQGYSFIDDAGKGGYGTVQALVNIVHEFRGDTSVAVAGTPLDSEADDWTAELGLAASFAGANGVYAVYGDAQVSTGLDDFADGYVLKGATGVKMMF